MKKHDAFALKSFNPAQILQRPYFREFNFDGDATDDEIVTVLRPADADSRQALETKFDTLVALIQRASAYSSFVKRHVDRLEKYRRAAAGENHAREQRLVTSYLIEIYLSVDELLEKLGQAFRVTDDALKDSYRRVFAERLKQVRQSTGMTQTEFGASLGLSQRAISSYEVASREPTLATLAHCARKLHRPLNWFLGLS